MASKNDDFDILTFFISVMLLLTVLVGGFAALYYRRVSVATASVKKEIGFLRAMGKLAKEDGLKGWISREREGAQQNTGNRSAADFQALYLKLSRAPQHRLTLTNHTLEGSIPHPGGTELPFRLIFKQCRVEELVKFLVKLEEMWPGARVKKITKLHYIERGETKGWDATVVVSIFKANT